MRVLIAVDDLTFPVGDGQSALDYPAGKRNRAKLKNFGFFKSALGNGGMIQPQQEKRIEPFPSFFHKQK